MGLLTSKLVCERGTLMERAMQPIVAVSSRDACAGCPGSAHASYQRGDRLSYLRHAARASPFALRPSTEPRMDSCDKAYPARRYDCRGTPERILQARQ